MAQSKTPVKSVVENNASDYLTNLDRYGLKFKNLICNFLKDQHKNCLLLETEGTRLVSFTVVHILKTMSQNCQEDVVLNRFLGPANQFHCQWLELAIGSSSSKHLHGLLNLVVCEVTNVEHLVQQEKFFQKLSRFLKLAVRKKIIFISPRCDTMHTFIKSIPEISKLVQIGNDFDESISSDKKPAVDKTLLYNAALNGSIDDVKLNLGDGVKIDERGGPRRGTALHAAAEKGHQNITIYLVKSHANVNIQDQDGNTPLHLATLGGHKEVITTLLDNEANVLSKDGIGQTVLHIAAKNGNMELVLLYIRRGADVNAADYLEHTPLYFAVEHGHYDATLALLLNDANVNISKCYGGITEPIANLLQQYDANKRPSSKPSLEYLDSDFVNLGNR